MCYIAVFDKSRLNSALTNAAPLSKAIAPRLISKKKFNLNGSFTSLMRDKKGGNKNDNAFIYLIDLLGK